jgi:SAM-dependent methyltransferase
MNENSLSAGNSVRKAHEEYRRYFHNRFVANGEDVRTLWGSRQSQEQRFAILMRIGGLDGSCILDVGCGFGDLFGYLRSHDVKPLRYLGADCVEEIVAVAKRRYPEASFTTSATFDLPETHGFDQFDYVFGSGIFFLKSPNWEHYAIAMIRRMYALARVAVGVNFLSRFSRHPDEVSQYSDPGSVLSLLMDHVTPNVELIHSYRPNDFTVFLYKETRPDDIQRSVPAIDSTD